jgi:prepilin-type processing-associated H-X9-DG protein
MKFSLATIAYVFALLAAAMATFGGGVGIGATAGVLAFWAWAYYKPARPSALGCVLSAALILMLLALLLPAGRWAREAARSAWCMNNLKHVGLALLRYATSKSGGLPQAATLDEKGGVLQSWRLEILPYLEQEWLYQRIRHDEPWDSAANRRLTSTAVNDVFQCPAHRSQGPHTHYFAVIGERTAWPPDRGRKLSEFRDGLPFTLLALEAPHKQAMWAEPVDFTFEEAIDYLTRTPTDRTGMHESRPGFFYKTTWSVNAVFADGHVGYLRLPLPREVAVAVLTVDGGEEIDVSSLQPWMEPELDYAKCYAFAAFVGLSLLPGVRLVRRTRLGEAPAA